MSAPWAPKSTWEVNSKERLHGKVSYRRGYWQFCSDIKSLLKLQDPSEGHRLDNDRCARWHRVWVWVQWGTLRWGTWTHTSNGKWWYRKRDEYGSCTWVACFCCPGKSHYWKPWQPHFRFKWTENEELKNMVFRSKVTCSPISVGLVWQ